MHTISRREFLRTSAILAAGSLAAACAQPAATPAAPVAEPSQPAETAPTAAGPTTPPSRYSEAPSLAALVAGGSLPPVEDRLPLEPLIVGPGLLVHEDDLDWEVGEYSQEGEILRCVTPNPNTSYLCRYLMPNFLCSPAHYTGPITGSLCSSWKVNEDCTEYEFTLRQGLKWSDGVPATTEDVRFAYEDVLMNEELTPVVGLAMRASASPDGEPLTLEVVDDFTFRVSFAAPNGTKFLREMGMGNLWNSYTGLMKPKHYLQQFHKDYISADELAAKCAAAGVGIDEWHRLFLDEGGGWGGGDCAACVTQDRMPTLRPWNLTHKAQDLFVQERNPYYWKVDIEGQQLPYVERLESVVVTSADNIPMKIVSGEITCSPGDNLNLTDLALYKEHEEKAGYRVSVSLTHHNAPVAVYFNLCNPDETWRQVVRQKEFRQAINAAIDFREIIDTLYLGMGTVNPRIPDVSDPDLANQMLDDLGLDQRDAEGWRLGPDGNRFEFRMDVSLQPLFIQPTEIIAVHLQEVGLYTPVKMIDPSLWSQMRDANELYASIDWSDDCNWPYLMTDYMPNERIKWAQTWHRWMETGGKDGEEPPDWMKDLYAMHAEMMAIDPNTTRASEVEKLFDEWFLEYVPILPVARDVANLDIIPPNVGNMAHSGRSSAVWFTEEQIFFKHA